ncbi:flagellin [Clostridia bacterium]|nr:flagellin [Clostridia bacterium]
MKINHNMPAVISNNQLLRTENSLSKSIERLSSGFRINHASDDAAGMAISLKMKAQIKGLDQASQNASDGNSVLNTADGALSEVTNMIQRMRELSVQAANDTNTPEDKAAIQKEIASLTDEIDRVSRDTEFNTKKLLNGNLERRVYPDTRLVDRIQISDSVPPDQYTVTIQTDAAKSVYESANTVSPGPVPAGADGTVSINGVEVSITEGQDLNSVFENLRNAAEQGEVKLFAVTLPTTIDPTDPDRAEYAGYEPEAFADGKNLVFVSDAYGSAAEIKITCDNPDLATFLGIPQGVTEAPAGVDAELADLSPGSGFGPQATWLSNGNVFTITDSSGFQMSFEAFPGLEGEDVNFDVTSIGTLTLQIGANENQTMDVRIPPISSKHLYIDKVNVTTIHGAGRAISSYDKALAQVSEARSRIGSYQNRLDHAIGSLDSTSENMTAALSRIEDVDMATEMSNFTKYNVLSQAATSVLAQANQLPQKVLQLLQ